MFAPRARAAAAAVPSLARSVHIEKRLEELGITLPAVVPPVANYCLVNRVGNLLYTGARAYDFVVVVYIYLVFKCLSSPECRPRAIFARVQFGCHPLLDSWTPSEAC